MVKGHSRSWAMSPFDRARTSFYSTLIETMRIFCTFTFTLVEHRLVTDRQTDRQTCKTVGDGVDEARLSVSVRASVHHSPQSEHGRVLNARTLIIAGAQNAEVVRCGAGGWVASTRR